MIKKQKQTNKQTKTTNKQTNKTKQNTKIEKSAYIFSAKNPYNPVSVTLTSLKRHWIQTKGYWHVFSTNGKRMPIPFLPNS